MRQHVVAVAVQQQYRRARLDLRAERFGRGQHAGEADDAGELFGATQSNMQRHHGALGEAQQDRLGLVKAVLRHRVVEEALDEGCRGAHAGRGDRRIEPGDTEPLVAEGIALAGIGRVGRMEHHVGHQRRQHRRKPDQVVAVGAVAMQQHHQMAGLAAALRPVMRAVDLLGHLVFGSVLGSFFRGLGPQSGMLRR